MEQALGQPVTFVPHLVPLDRGILSSIYARLVPGTTADSGDRRVRAGAYADAPFVRLTGATLPEIKHVAHTNFCDIGWKVDTATGRVFVVSVIDNLVKGAAGQAIQNFNVMHGFDQNGGSAMKRVSVVKLGGELIENDLRLKAMGRAIASAARKGRMVVVHGGGREIDAALAQVGIPKRQVDGLRVTDPETLNIVVSVLAGTINTKFVAAINAAGGKAVGLTGADAGRGAGREGRAAQGDQRRNGRPRNGRNADQSAVARGDRGAVQGGLRAGDRVRERG